ncbi:NXPE family member 3 isoform X2 [Xenopus laevis]|uniref:NXPE family member 3 isoform X2 n=2 Tax=Xenopus laevis TaxID=8355 RepID=A0A1L8G0B1_XENLA|nr:NXPE family member 3 isoform X2 [Xenopus laevis]OCT77296.1 hypothetical protein XELAEV_18032495mg [Xenopus laevis]
MLGRERRVSISTGFLLCLIFIVGFIYRFVQLKPLEKCPPPDPWQNVTQQNQSSPAAIDLELQTLMRMIEWPEPLGPTDFESSTSPFKTEFHMPFPRATYYVGEYVEVFIIAQDHRGQPKTYGGDYFQAKLHSPMLKAGVTGSVTDHRNGTYTASFLLLWPGQVEISIRLVHSSEAIIVHKTLRNTRLDKVIFQGTINGSSRVLKCHVWPQSGPNVCEFHDPDSGESWYCEHQSHDPCGQYKGHLEGIRNHILRAEEHRLLSEKEKLIKSRVEPFNVLPSNKTDNRSVCSPGLPIPDPSGFYYQDFWQSRVCRNRAFPSPSAVTQCLTGKAIYLFGDSTAKQWWKYLIDFIPSLLEINLYEELPAALPGPLVAVDTEHKIGLHWQGHHIALTLATSVNQDLHFIATELDQLGGAGLVVVINCLAHYVLYPVKVYVNKLRKIRESVLLLMKRSPLSKVFIKSGNTGYKYIYGSDWLSLQLDLVMRAMFSELPVTILDNWQMTTCHYLHQDLHPAPVIIKNEIDLLLSFICPM